MTENLNDTSDELLGKALKFAVPLWFKELRGKPFEYWDTRREICSKHIAAHGDHILYRGSRAGQSAEAFNRLAEGIALLLLITKHDIPEPIGGVQFRYIEMEDLWSAGMKNK